MFNATIDSVLGACMTVMTIISIVGNALALRVFIGLSKTRANILFTKLVSSFYMLYLTLFRGLN